MLIEAKRRLIAGFHFDAPIGDLFLKGRLPKPGLRAVAASVLRSADPRLPRLSG
jgi:hypothetical protein